MIDPLTRLVVRHSSFVVRQSSFVIRRSSFVNRHSSFVVRRSSIVVRRSSFVIRRSSFVIRRSSPLYPHIPPIPHRAGLPQRGQHLQQIGDLGHPLLGAAASFQRRMKASTVSGVGWSGMWVALSGA